MQTIYKLILVGGSSVGVLLSALLLGMQGAAGSASLGMYIDDAAHVRVGDTIKVNVYCTPTSSRVKAFECKLRFDKTKLNALQVTEGDFFKPYQTFFNAGTIDNPNGRIVNIYNLIVGQGYKETNGIVFNVTFNAIHTGYVNITFYDVGITNETQYIQNYAVNYTNLFIYSRYDINWDRTVNVQDIIQAANRYGQTGTPGWIDEDINNDGKISVLDLVLIAVNYGAY